MDILVRYSFVFKFTIFQLFFNYSLVRRQRSYWPDRGVTQGPPPLPLLGNMHQRMSADLYYKETEWAQQYGKIYGFFLGPIPALMVTDVELVKQVLIKVLMQQHLFPVSN